MVTIYQVYKLQYKDDRWGGEVRYELTPFWRDDSSDRRRYAWVPFFDTREEAIAFINRQNPHSGEYTILEVFTGRRPHELPEPPPGSYS